VGIPSAILLLGAIIWFIAEALTAERGYEVTIVEEDSERTINSEEARLPESQQNPEAADTPREQVFRLVLVNASGEIGLAAAEAQRLTEASYVVDAVEPELEKTARRTVVVAPPTMTEAAKKLSEYYGNALVSIVPEVAPGDLPTISVYLGEDRK
jgi:LytR cell envelope-related transcriptional attenuator